jgi:glutamate formiminotransferase
MPKIVECVPNFSEGRNKEVKLEKLKINRLKNLLRPFKN